MAVRLVQGKQIATASWANNAISSSYASTASYAPLYTPTSSFNEFTQSYNTGSFTGSFTGDGTGLYNIPASGIVGLNLSQISSGSASASISPETGLQVNAGVTAPSFSGSFSGSGADLFNIPASGIVGLNLSQIISGSVSASISPDSGLQINTNVTATSFTGSLLGTASYATNALSSSYALTASFALNYTPTSSFNNFTSSYYQDSSSFDSRINNLPISQLVREEFTWISGSSQVFQLLSTASQVYSVEVQGQGALSQTQYLVTGSNRVQILDQLQSNDYVVILYTNATTGFQPYYSQAQVDGLVNNKQNSLGFTPENVANKSTLTSLGTSDTLYPTQNAVKSYVDSKAIRTMYLYFPIFQNAAASTSWYALPETGQILTGTGYTVNAAITDANDFANLSYLTPRIFCPFKHKIKSVEVHGSTNAINPNPVTFAVVSSYEPFVNSGVLVISNPLVVAKEGITIWVGGAGNGFQKKFSDANLVTTTRNAGSDYRIVFKNQNQTSNLQRTMLIVELEEVL